MSIFELMGHYVPHRNWRARLGVNAAAARIWTLWVLSATFLLGAAGTLLIHGDLVALLVCLGVAIGLFAGSFALLKEATRLHQILQVMDNPILKGGYTR